MHSRWVLDYPESKNQLRFGRVWGKGVCSQQMYPIYQAHIHDQGQATCQDYESGLQNTVPSC